MENLWIKDGFDMPANSKETSQYLNTPIKDWYLDIYVPRFVANNDFDTIVVVPPKYNQRPDLMSQELYGTPRMWWVFAVRNPDLFSDPISDFLSGTRFYAPSNILKG
jgi:hypothetical protein